VDERVLTPSTSVLTVLVVGMVAGHVLMPARPIATVAARAGFVVVVAAAGALGGWRTGRVIDRVPALRSGAGALVSAIAGALVALGLAAAGYAVVHG
jgi:hypothetical protein